MQYIFKIAPASPKPSTTQDADASILPASSLDTASGFIHMSTAAQVPGTLKHFFPTTSGTDTIFLLRVKLPVMSGQLRWESPDATVCGPRPEEGLFPHIYFEDSRLSLRCGDIDSVREVVSVEGTEGWEDALKSVEGWLV